MRFVVVALIIALCVLHHDYWWWNDAEPLVFGFVPIGLAWHAGISLAAGCVWFLAVKFCWPSTLEDASREESGGE